MLASINSKGEDAVHQFPAGSWPRAAFRLARLEGMPTLAQSKGCRIRSGGKEEVLLSAGEHLLLGVSQNKGTPKMSGILLVSHKKGTL